MSVGFHQLGDAVRLHTEDYPFKNAAGVDTNPTATTLTMVEPDGVKTTYTFGVDGALTNSAAGKFSLTWITAKVGRHHWRWKGTGAATAADTGEFYVEGTPAT